MTMRSANALVDKALADPQLLQKIKSEPEKELPKLAQEVVNQLPIPLMEDFWLYRIVVGSLGLAVLGAVIGAIVLSAIGASSTPDILTAIGSAAVGALAGLLAPSPVKQPKP